MSSPKLTEFLRQHRDDQQSSAEVQRLLKEEWVRAVNDLLNDVTNWLKPQEAEGLLKVTRVEDVTLQEDRLGIYKVPALEIQVGARAISVLPIARLIFGGAGRVDLAYGPRVKILLRTDPTAKVVHSPDDGPRKAGPLTWMISGTDPRDRGTELTEESLSDAIQFLLS
ncbi:MAG TPA: hypothetical protein VH853_21655 [Polyangia bacterium]|jgi:hypothetical protein|nr:hypothetical protein [Polyangia bacterium]